MYRHSPVKNPRSKGIKIKNILQVCLLAAVCFWLIFQVKRSHDKKKEFDATDKLTTLNTRSSEEIVKFGRKDLPQKLDEIVKEVEKHEDEHEQEQEEEEEQEDNKHEEEEVEEDKIDEEKDDEIDENDQEKSDVEIDREEVDIIDEDKETEESESEKENEESQTDNTVDHDEEHTHELREEHTHELREEHYKADDASSAVTHDGRSLGTENEIKNGTFGQTPKNETSSDIQENDSEPLDSSVNPASSMDSLENGPPSNTTVITSNSTLDQNVTNSTYVSENSGSDLETNNVIEGTEETLDSDSTDPSHLEEKDTLPEIETEGGNSEDTAAE